jgi:cell division protein FtsI/penicillin-binding protein 2
MYDVSVVPRHVKDKAAVAKELAASLGGDEKQIFDTINCDKWYVPPIKKRVEKSVVDAIKAKNLDGVYFQAEYARFYPEKDFLSQTLGFVDYNGNGKYGVEEYYDGILKGEGGTLKGLKDNTGRVIKLEESEPGKDGSSIVLTIDRSIQYMAEKKLKEGMDRYGAEGGSIIIMDPSTGAILAMASNPSYDPNKFNEISGDGQKIFLNPATSLGWEPGSIFKPIVAAIGIADGKVEPDSKPTEAEGGFGESVNVDGYDIHNALKKSYGFETVTQILENSDNVGMVWIANKLGNETMANYFKKFGFGAKTGVDIAGETSGQVAPAKKWKDVNRATISFGQGITVTPLQIVSAFATLANKGKYVKPRILDKIIDASGKEKTIKPDEPVEVVSEDVASKTTGMLVSVVENGHGKKAGVDGFKVAGKTGTAQIPKEGGGYDDVNTIGSFAGYAPADNPKFVMLVKLDKPKTVEWAESSAAPIFGEISDWLLNSYLKVPKTEK